MSVYEKVREYATRTPEAEAVLSGPDRLTFRELDRQIEAEATRLHGLGIGKGGSVLVVAENSARYLVVSLAVMKLGGILSTIYPGSGQTELAYVIQNSTPQIVFADAARMESVNKAILAAQVSTLLLALEQTYDGAPAPLPPVSMEPEAPCLVCYTSGTTARPKPVAHSYAGVLGVAEVYGRLWHVTPKDKMLVALPLAWIYGLATASFTALINGAGVVLLPHFNPVKVTDIIEREGVTFFPAVTTMFVKLVNYVNENGLKPDFSSLRVCISGGEARNETIFGQWTSMTGCQVHDVYASSECFPQVTYDVLADPVPKRGSAGKVAPGAELLILDAEGRPVEPGNVGIGFARSVGMMLGYWNEPELTKSVMTEDGWYKTNDLMRIDEDGYVYVVGRASDMIIRGGSNVSPAEVEDVLVKHPKIREAVIFGLPDEMYGQQVATAVITHDDAELTLEEIAAFCKEHLASYKIPTAMRRFQDFPRNLNGKTLRRELIALFDQPGRA